MAARVRGSLLGDALRDTADATGWGTKEATTRNRGFQLGRRRRILFSPPHLQVVSPCLPRAAGARQRGPASRRRHQNALLVPCPSGPQRSTAVLAMTPALCWRARLRPINLTASEIKTAGCLRGGHAGAAAVLLCGSCAAGRWTKRLRESSGGLMATLKKAAAAISRGVDRCGSCHCLVTLAPKSPTGKNAVGSSISTSKRSSPTLVLLCALR